jgi:hypothetical protein
MSESTTEPTPAEYAEMPVRITRDSVFIGDYKIPGCIAARGITVRPGEPGEPNTLVVEFLTGEIKVDDPWVTEQTVKVTRTAVRYDVAEQPSDVQDGPAETLTRIANDLRSANR